jgi:hypothetical protein
MEYRRSAAQGPPRGGYPGVPAPPGGRPRQGDPGGYPMPMLGSEGMLPGASPYYPRQQHPSPYGRPYMAGQGGYGGVHSPNDLAAGMYGRRAAGQMYGYGVPPHGPSSGTSPDQRYAHPSHYGMPPNHSSDAYAQYYGRQHDMYGQRPPDGMGSHHNPYGPQSPKQPSPPSRATPPGIPGSAGSKGLSADDDDDGDRHDNGSNSGSGSEDNDDDDEEHEDHLADGQKWFHGSIPLGLEDDKYWLSELQVYLRAHFAEAFGATEDDIAGEEKLNYLI